MTWEVENRRENWNVLWTGTKGDTIHDDLSFLSRERAEAVCEALNATERREMRILRRVRREVQREMLAEIANRATNGVVE